MFKIKNILGISALALTCFSCDDFLDTPPVDLLNVDGFYQSQDQADQGILGIYADLDAAASNEFWFMSECRSDIAWVDPEPDALREYSEIGTFRATDNLELFNNTWNMWYKVIYDANVAIAKIPECAFESEEIKKQFLNEAYFLRGWAYFELVRLFGNVPLVEKVMSPTEIKSVKQSEAIDILNNRVIPDLKNAEALPYKKDMKNGKCKSAAKYGRADKMAAKAMLARVYATLAGFPYNDTAAKSLVKTQLESVLNDSEAAQYWAPSLSEWRKQWLPSDDYYNKYSVFAIQYRIGGSGNQALTDMIPPKYLPESYSKWNFRMSNIYVEKTLMHEFDKVNDLNEKDGRGYGHSVLEKYDAEGNVAAYSSPKETMTFDDGVTADVYVEAMFYKYLPTKVKSKELGLSIVDENSMTKYDDWGVNYPVIRIEDMQLLYAELLAEEGNTEEAIKIVNKIRMRANCKAYPELGVSKDDAMKYIKLERKLEFMGEGIRWFDQIRYGTWKTDTEAKFDRYNYSELKANLKEESYLYPIPLNQMNVTPGLYEQNDAYRN